MDSPFIFLLMNLLDILTIIIMSVLTIKGFWRGFANEASSFLGLALGVWSAYIYNQELGTMIAGFTVLSI